MLVGKQPNLVNKCIQQPRVYRGGKCMPFKSISQVKIEECFMNVNEVLNMWNAIWEFRQK